MSVWPIYPFVQKPGRIESLWKYSSVWAYVELALLGCNEPVEVSSASIYVFFTSFLNKEFPSLPCKDVAWPIQKLLLLMVLVYNIGIPGGNCVGGTDNVAIAMATLSVPMHWWWGGYWWCWWGRQSRYGGGQFPPNPGQRQQDLALTKQSRPLRQTGAESADAFSYFQPLLVPILGRHSLLWTHPALLPSSSTVLFSRYFADHASMEPFTHNYEPECNVWRHIGMKGVPSKRMRRHFLEAMRVE